MKNRGGRPKMTIEEHLGLKPAGFKKRKKPPLETCDDPTYMEAREILLQVYDKIGYSTCLGILDKFQVPRLSDLGEEHFSRFIALCQEKLNQ